MDFKLDELTGSSPYGGTSDMVSYLQCPYYGEHTIAAGRMAFHLEKCRKAFPDIPKKPCPFDATHYVNEPELKFHITTCSKRGVFDTYKYNVGECSTSKLELPPPPVVPDAEENWDDSNVAGYNPQDNIAGKKIIRKLTGAQPAERKNFRLQERQKFSSHLE